MTNPIPYYKGQRDYYSRTDPRYDKHISEIYTHERIDRRIDASSGDHSYSVTVTRKDINHV
jgi:hypothetical protein